MKAKWMPLNYQRRKGVALFPDKVNVQTDVGQTAPAIDVIDSNDVEVFRRSFDFGVLKLS